MIDLSTVTDISIGGKAVDAISVDGRVWWKKQASGDPQWYTDAVVCHYSPKKQGCTNASMSLSPILEDLSGNGHDMTCYNFGWNLNSGIVGSYLKFDNVDDYAKGTGFPIMTDFTVMALVSLNYGVGSNVFASKSTPTASSGAFLLGMRANNTTNEIRSFGTLTQDIPYVLSAPVVLAENKNRVYTDYDNGVYTDIQSGTGKDTDSLWIGRLRDGNTIYGNINLYSFLMFNRTLTDDEMTWVRANKITEL